MSARLPLALALAGCVVLAAGPHGAQAQAMQPGQWSLAMRIDVGSQSETPPPVGACITQQDIDDATKTLPRPNGRCVLSNVQRTAERATYNVACLDGAIQSRCTATIVYRGDRYDGVVKMIYSERGTPEREMGIAISARRTGDCVK